MQARGDDPYILKDETRFPMECSELSTEPTISAIWYKYKRLKQTAFSIYKSDGMSRGIDQTQSRNQSKVK